MSAAARIVLAGVAALALTISHAAYSAWPGWRGVEIYLAASLYPADPAGTGNVRIDLPAERLRLNVSRGVDEPQAELFQPVRGVGSLWASGSASSSTVRSRRGRDLFVQLAPEQPLWPQGPVSMRPTGVSDTPIAGVINLAGQVTRADARGYVWLTFGSHQMPVPPTIASRTTPRDVVRQPNRPPETMGRPADPGTFAIFRVLPSGRAVLAGLIVEGKRIE